MSETLWLIIYSLGHIGGVAGPLPYDMTECMKRRDELRMQQEHGLDAGINIKTSQPLTDEEIDGIAGLSFECEYRSERPALGDPQPTP